MNQDQLNQRTADRFNEKYPVGSTVKWCPYIGAEPIEQTVRDEAFVTNGNPVVFFEGVRGYCSIEPGFIKD